jgi:hypothetical protein
MKDIAIWLFLVSTSLAGETSGWISAREIERLSLTIALVDFPIRESAAKEVLGLPVKMPPLIGGSSSIHNREYLISALSDPDDPKGFYAIRFLYPESRVQPSDSILRKEASLSLQEPERMITGIDILFWSISPDLKFKVEIREPQQLIEIMKARMKEKKMSPLEFSRELTSFPSASQKNEPNQALEPTPTAVTDRAAHAPRQP